MTRLTPFQMVFELEAVIPIEFQISSLRVWVAEGLDEEHPERIRKRATSHIRRKWTRVDVAFRTHAEESKSLCRSTLTGEREIVRHRQTNVSISNQNGVHAGETMISTDRSLLNIQ